MKEITIQIKKYGALTVPTLLLKEVNLNWGENADFVDIFTKGDKIVIQKATPRNSQATRYPFS